MSTFTSDFFEFFGIDKKLSIDEVHLQRRFYELSRQWHPDRFSRKSEEEQNQALEATAILNDGYRTLKDPVKRAEYVLTQEGFPIGEQRSKDVPPELLEEVFELNMMLEELREGDTSAKSQLEAARINFVSTQDGIQKQLQNLFAKYDSAAPESEQSQEALGEIRSVLNRRRYIENLIRDVEQALKPELSKEQNL